MRWNLIIMIIVVLAKYNICARIHTYIVHMYTWMHCIAWNYEAFPTLEKHDAILILHSGLLSLNAPLQTWLEKLFENKILMMAAIMTTMMVTTTTMVTLATMIWVTTKPAMWWSSRPSCSRSVLVPLPLPREPFYLNPLKTISNIATKSSPSQNHHCANYQDLLTKLHSLNILTIS